MRVFHRRRGFVLLVLFYSALVHAQSGPPGAAGGLAVQSSSQILPLEVVVNGAKMGTWLLLERDGEMYAPADALKEWRVQMPAGAKPIDFQLDDQNYWPLSAVPGFKFKLDYANQSAELLFSPQAFAATQVLREKSKKPVVAPVLPSLFLNYDLNYLTAAQNNAPSAKDLGLLTEVGASGQLGVLTSSQVGRNLANDPAAPNAKGWLRLETTFTKDFPDDNRTLRLGDTSTRASMWGRNVYFGGIQYGSNFALTPGFISQPVPALVGMSTAPSTVEMYVNNVLRQSTSVPTGPFAIDNSTILTGSGDVRMVVTDLLGRQTVIEQSFFTSSQLLASGLDDWSVEAGSVRRDLGINSNTYGPGFAGGTWRHGYSDAVTLEGRTELTQQQKTLGMGVLSSLPGQILGKASVGLSSGQNQNGGLWLLGMEHQSLHNSVTFQVQRASPNFRQLGQDPRIQPIKLQVSGNWTHITGSSSSYGIGVASLSRFDNSRISTISCNYSTRVGQRSNLTFTASRAIYGVNGTSAGVFFVMPLDNSRVVSASAAKQDSYVSATQNPDHENHLGWRALAGRMQGLAHEEGGVSYLGRYGRVSGDASASPGQRAVRLGASGGLVLADSSVFASERIDQSFALVKVGDYDNVGVGLGSNVLAHTDANGVALVPRLLPYQNNSVRIAADDLPVSAEITSIEQYAVPAWRSAVKVEFPVRSGRGALLSIVLDDGEAAPAGAVVHIQGDSEEFYVARRGAAFVTGLQSSNALVLDWNGQQCIMDVKLPPKTPDEIPRVGPLLCKGVRR